jgi:CBS-domain-containing membrane protein
MFVPKEGRQPGRGAPSSLTRATELHAHPPLNASFTLGERAPLSVLLTHEAIAVPRGTRVDPVVSFMLRMALNTLPVIDGDGDLCGVVSIHDLLADAAAHGETVEQEAGLRPREGEALNDALDGRFHGTRISTASIGDVMTASTLALSDDTPISRAVLTLTREGLSEVPVRCGQCQGYCIVSALELLRWLSRSRLGAR